VAQALRQISSVEGAKTLWRGVASVILGAGPAHAVYFGTYEVVKEMTGGNRQGHQFASTGELRAVTAAQSAQACGRTSRAARACLGVRARAPRARWRADVHPVQPLPAPRRRSQPMRS